MADSMPICDVLSEAMEYLSKLGTNIRIRSENLRDKRIRKEKLRNTHAIHKAVDKVLLICELSKKSIENVETGVKNLLLQMEMAGSSFGPGPTTRDRSNSEVTFEYFTYQSRRLKIRNKISVEHYTSVKVVSTSMTIPMLEKYPVYYDCKLYRMRKKKKMKQIQSWLSEHGEVSEGSAVSTTAVTSLSTMDPKPSECMQICEPTSSDNIIKNSEDVPPTDSHKINKNNKLGNDINSDTFVHENKCVDKQSTFIIQDKSEMNSDDDKYESDFEVKHKKKKYKAKKMRHARLLDDDSNSDKEAGGKNEKEEDSLYQTESKLCSDIFEASSTEHKNDQEKGENGGETTRPIIKCVSLSKLLKPEIAKSIDAESKDETRKSKTKDKHFERRQERLSRSEHKREAKYKRLRYLDTSDEDEDDYAYWARKQKEVKKFKAKNFDINLDRLPKITTTFLEDQNLKRITQNGDVVCEIKSEVCEEQCYNKESNESEPQPKRIKINNTVKNNPKQKIDIDKVKSSLLDDSDSDNIDTVQNKNLHQTTHGQMNNHYLGIADNMQDNTSVQEVSDVHGAEIVNNSEDFVCSVSSPNISSDCNESQDVQNCSSQEPQCNEKVNSDKETACSSERNVKEELDQDKEKLNLDEIEADIPKNTNDHRKVKNNALKKIRSSAHTECNDKGSTIIQRKDEDTKEMENTQVDEMDSKIEKKEKHIKSDGIMEVKTTRHHKHHKPSHNEKQNSNNDHLDNSKHGDSHIGTDNEDSNDSKNSTVEIPDSEVQKMEQETQNDDKQKNSYSGEFDPDSPHKIKENLGSTSYCNILNSELNQDEHTEAIRNFLNLEGSDSEPHKRKENEDNTQKKPFFGQADSENVNEKKDLVAVKALSTFSESENKTQNREQQNDVNTFKKSLNEKASYETPNIEKEHGVPDATESNFKEECSITLEGQSHKNNTPVKDQQNKKPKVTEANKKKKSHHNKSEYKGGTGTVKKSLHNEPGSEYSKGQKSSEVKKSLNESGCEGEKRQEEPNSLLNKPDCGRENGQDAEEVQKSLLNEFNRECDNIQDSEQSKKSLNGSNFKTDNILNLEQLKNYHLNESDDKSESSKSDSDSEKLQNAHEVKISLLNESNYQDINIQNSDEVKKSRLYESDCGGDNIQDAENVKKSLLNESDSESDKVQDVEEVKKSLLNESDSDCDKVQGAEVKKSHLNESDSDCDKVQDAEVKKSHLNESDSDCDKVQDAEEVKKSLLNESDSDCDKVQDAEEIKKSLLNESDSDCEKVQDAEALKRSLLNESEDESDKVQNEEEIKKSLLNESEDESEKELNAEVKKSLLNESASERDKEQDAEEVKKSLDCEGDKVQDVEEIKKSLLNESEDEGDKEQNTEEIKKSLLNESEDESEKELNAEEVKKSLLNESDCEGDNVQDTEEIKKSLLNESDCDNDEHYSDEVKKTLLNESGCEGEKKQDETQFNNLPISELNCEANNETINGMFETEEKTSKVIEENELQEQIRSPPCDEDTGILKSNPKDSSDDRLKTPKKRKSYSGDSPSQSKRKHMESIYAKKMLLTYSSSSETDDEQLRNTLKEIRDCLLKGISSDEEVQDIKKNKKESDVDDDNTRNNESKKVSSDSDNLSEEDLFKRNTVKKENFDSDSKEASCKGPTSGSISDNSIITKMGRSRATRGGSCSQNSDLLDDREINGLTNLKSLKKTHRRRDSSSTENTQSTRSGRREMAKAGGLISNEGFLQAESSSDAVSLSGSEHADNTDSAYLEEMPRVKLSDINGGGIGHLAKDDLLGESDTSVSHDEKRDSKGGDDTDEENVKSKRRKQHAISSDSEAGSSRRKDHLRLSDFEDSEDESSEGPVKNKRKKKQVDSDASGTSSQDGKKKRRRIKTLDESDGSGSDTENEGRNKHGRKNIRKVMGKSQLEEATKKAAREEKERIARIAERQKLYNNLEFDESGKPDEVVLEKVVLDFDPETKEPLIQVDRGLVKKLKPHQANGIKFMWDACFESVKRIKKDKGSGCILAHCMGLGKTLQVVSLTHTLLTHAALTGVHRVLVVCPLSTVLNWVNEFRMWLKHAEADFEVDVYELSKFKQNSERAFQLSQWFEHGGVCVLGYEMFRNLSADNVKKFKKKLLKNFQESLVDPGPDLVVCDEGHLLKNEKTSLSQSMNRVKTRRRIVLTGTPLQNNLKEYYCMVQFVKPNLLGKYNEYLNRFVNPITNGQYTDSTEHDIRVMKRRSHVLHKMLDGAVQRRDYGVLAPFLPPKHEYVLFITLTEVQIKLYQHYIDNYSRQPSQGKSSGFLFPDFQSLQRIWTHPLVLKYNSERYEIMQQKKREKEEEDSEGSLRDFIDDDSTPSESSSESSSDDLSDLSDDSRKKSKKKKSPKKSKTKESKVGPRRGTRANPIDVDDEEPEEEKKENENPTEWWMKLVSEEELEDMRHSSKLVLLFDILRQCEAIGDKLLVFSQSLYSLDLIEHFLGKVDEATQEGRVDEKLGGHIGTWSPGLDYFRLDGSTSCENRSIWCKNFNMVDNPRARLFLISTRAGGLGINLVAANRVVIFDVSWNPSHDVQSIFRVYRFGQKKPCYIYRFLAMGTMEEKIYERQVTKQAISKRVIDEQQIDRHYAENDLAELYKFEPHPPVPRPIPPLPKDRLFAEMLREHEAQIYKYHEHDSLLENKEEETLSEEERKAAWEDFENEKTRPPPQPMLSPYMHNGMMGGLLAQQQQHQQMMLAALAAMVRKDMPNMNDQQIRDAVTLMYNSNPAMYGGYDYGVMQKMADMYKYAQPGMMNPGMMNPAAGAGGAVGAGSMGMGGASGLQYEPPWQRQQQHQQQLRLQQIMAQQQNSMGAKYYAGGLGSRDPMAMALQQQRARELMLRPRSRGRPPHSALAHAPPAAHAHTSAPPAPLAGDVVNLDSD